MADVKVSALTALTGANLANGDQFLVTDVGTPNVSKSITADEWAQASQLSSRYKPLASDVLWISGSAMSATSGSPIVNQVGAGNFWARKAVMLMDSAALEIVQATVIIPPGWSTANMYLWWTNAGAGSGNVRLAVWDWDISDGNSIDGDDLIYLDNVAAPAQLVAERTLIAGTRPVTGNALLSFQIARVGDDVADTLANDVGVIGFELVRAS